MEEPKSFSHRLRGLRRWSAGAAKGVNEFGIKPEFPSLHHRKEGWLRHQENLA